MCDFAPTVANIDWVLTLGKQFTKFFKSFLVHTLIENDLHEVPGPYTSYHPHDGRCIIVNHDLVIATSVDALSVDALPGSVARSASSVLSTLTRSMHFRLGNAPHRCNSNARSDA